MEDNSKELLLLQEIFDHIPKKFASNTERLAVFDAFIQLAQNPTSMSAGFGIEESYPYIERNLSERYGLSKVYTNAVISFLKDSVRRMKEINYNFDFWKKAVADYIVRRYSTEFIDWYLSIYKKFSGDKRVEFLFLLYSLLIVDKVEVVSRWYSCFFDKGEKLKEDDIKSLLIKFGLGNILYYRTTRGYTDKVFVKTLFLKELGERFRDKIPVKEDQIEEFFKQLSLADLKILDMCSKEEAPILENRVGKISVSARLIVEASRSYFAISPFAIEPLRDLIKQRKEELTSAWKKKFDQFLNDFVADAYPFADFRIIFEIEGAYCWKIEYTDNPEKEPIIVGMLLAPYIFKLSPYTTVLDEMRSKLGSQLNLIFFICETLPAVVDNLRYVNQKNLIFIFNEREKKFYVVEKSGKLSEDEELIVNSFLSKFLVIGEKYIQIGKTWPNYLENYLNTLKYFDKFPNLVSLRLRIPMIELKLRKSLRKRFEEIYGELWKEKIKEELPKLISKLERIIKSRPDKENVKDFLDGATLGELINIIEKFYKELKIDKSGISLLNLINYHRKILTHPIKDVKEDIDEKTFNRLKIALDYIEKVICFC